MEEKKQVEYSIEVQDILGRPPRKLIRWGISIVSSVFFLIIVGAFIFKYPVIISAPVILYSQNPPIDVVSEADGRLDTILFKNESQVKQGDYIAVIRSTAKTEDIFKLIEFQGKIRRPQDSTALISLPANHLEIGELQDHYALFRYNLVRYHKEKPKAYFSKRNILLDNRHEILNQELKIARKKLTLSAEELKVGKKRLLRDSLLHAQSVFSKAQFEASQESFLQLQREFKRLENEVATQQAQINSVRTENLDLDYRRFEHNENIDNQLVQSFQSLKQALAEWKKRYLLQAPIDGILNFNQFWYENQFVKSGETVFSVLPMKSGKIVGRVQVPPTNAGLIKQGQTVRIKLHNYPYLEFGSLTGEVNWISETPDKGRYLVEVELAHFKTNYQKNIRFQQEMMGTADIITAKRRFIVQLVSPLRWIFSDTTH